MANMELNHNLLKAAREGRYSEMERLIKDGKGGRVDSTDESGWSPLHALTSANRNLNIIPTGTKVNVNIFNSNHPSPLYYEVKKGNLKNVRWLLNQGADTDTVHSNNQSALDLVRVNNKDMINLLVSFAADKWIQGKDVTRDAAIHEAIAAISSSRP